MAQEENILKLQLSTTSSCSSISSRTYNIKNDQLVARLLKSTATTPKCNNFLRFERQRTEAELQVQFQTKMDADRRKWKLEKEKEIESISSSIKNQYEQKLAAVVRMKDKESKYLKNRLSAIEDSPTSSFRGSRKLLFGLLNSVPVAGDTEDAGVGITTSRKSKLSDIGDLRLLIAQLRSRVVELEKGNRAKESEICHWKRHQNAEVQKISAHTNSHVRSLIEEVRRKERQIAKLENVLKVKEREIGILSVRELKGEKVVEKQTASSNLTDKMRQTNESREQISEMDNKETSVMSKPNSDSKKSSPKRKSNRRGSHKNLHEDSQHYVPLGTISEESEDATVTGVDEWTEDSTQENNHEESLSTFGSLVNSLGSDSEWAREKLKYTTLVDSLKSKIEDLENIREKLENELQESKEENELLEFKLLEIEESTKQTNIQIGNSKDYCKKCACEQSNCISDDEGFLSVDSSGEENLEKEQPVENIKLQFILLKHSKDLAPEYKNVVTRVKSIWESLENQHSKCKLREMALEMKLRETEADWKSRFQNLERICCSSNPQSPSSFETEGVEHKIFDFREKSLRQFQELESCREENVKLTDELDSLKLKYSKIAEESEEEMDRLKKINSEYQESLNGFRKLEDRLTHKLADAERKYEDVKQKFRDSLKIIRDYESDDAKLTEKMKNLSRRNQNLTDELEKLTNANLELRENASAWEQKCFKLERQIESLNYDLRYKSDLLLYQAKNQPSKQILSLQFRQIAPSNEAKRDQSSITDQNSSISIFNKYLDAQKQLTRFKAYCWHLESQFEIQIKTVQVLKEELVSLRNAHPEKFINDQPNRLSIDNNNNQNCLPLIRHLLHFFPKSIRTVDDWRVFSESVQRFLRSTRQCRTNECFDRLRNILSSLISPVDKEEKRDNLGFQTLELTEDHPVHVWKDCEHYFLLQHQELFNVILKEAKSVLVDYCIDVEKLRKLYSNSSAFSYIERPAETSDTESETRDQTFSFITGNCIQFGDDSTEGGSNSSLPNSSTAGFNGGSAEIIFDDDSVFEVQYSETIRGIDKQSGRRRNNNLAAIRTLGPPSHFRILSDLKDGRYFAAWEPPKILIDIGGYKIYINDELTKMISNPFCSKTIVDCAKEKDLHSLSIASASDNFHTESVRVYIQERNFWTKGFKKTVTSITKATREDDDEECTEV